MARPALAYHHALTESAKQFSCQQVVNVRFCRCRRTLVFLQPCLYLIEHIVRQYRRNAAGDNYILITILSDILAIFQNAVEAIRREWLAAFRFQPPPVEVLHDGADNFAVSISLKNLPHQRSCNRVENELLLFLIQQIAKRNAATIVSAFQGVLLLPSVDFFGQLSGVIFGVALQHGFKDDALRPVGDILLDGYDLHAVLLQNPLVVGAVVAVTGKAVELPDQHHTEQLLLAVLYHVLKFRSVRGSGGQGSVDVTAENGDAVSFGILRTLAELPFNAFFSLAVRGIAGVDYGFHFVSTSESICTSIAFNRLFMAEPGSKHISTNRAISGLFRPSFTQLL